MTDQNRAALESIRLDWAATPDDVWDAESLVHVPGLHESTIDDILRAFADAQRSTTSSPLGVAVRGPAGAGKTHLLGQVRERVHAAGGYFVLVKLLDGEDFWRSILVGLLEDLSRPTPTHRSQLTQLLDRLGQDAAFPAEQLAAILGEAPLTPEILDDYVKAVYTKHSRHRRRSQHILRALVLTECDDFEIKDLGESFLHLDTDSGEEFGVWGIRAARLGYQEIVENISRIVAFDNAMLLAVDQIDTLIEAGKSENREDENAVEKLAHGLMSLRETMSRTASVVSCITAAWEYLESHVMRSAVDRFRQPPILQRPDSAGFGTALLAKRFGVGFAEIGFTPPYPTWPVTEQALAASMDYTPRELMRAADHHIGRCLRSGEIVELTELGSRQENRPRRDSDGETDSPADVLDQLDRRYAELIAAADPAPALDPDSEDVVVPRLLQAGLASWIEARDDDATRFAQDPPPGAKAVLHGRLRYLLDPETDAASSWAFRAIAATHPRSVQSRLANATTAAGLTLGTLQRTLIVLRRTPWPSGAKTAAMVEELQSRDGHVIAWSDDDIRRLMALQQLRSERSEFLSEWLAARHPAGEITFLGDIAVPTTTTTTTPTQTGHDGASAADTGTDGAHSAHDRAEEKDDTRDPTTPDGGAVDTGAPCIALGVNVTDKDTVTIDLEALRKHTAIFAGSGSGKTVLIRRIVEECALQGVSSIVLDINNDLARLGTPWPDGTRVWSSPDEKSAAAEYLRGTEVVVFTPGRNSGRPLGFRPLPDFTAINDDPDEFGAAVDSAVGALAPRARAVGRTSRTQRLEAVLRQAMSAFGRGGGGSLRAFVAYLSDLPDGVSNLGDAARLANELAENLKASMAIDTVFGGDGTPADPGVLLTPSDGFRARVSVINLAGLGSDEKRANFVNELQMALFAWIKKHPAGDRPLGGLLVMDEAQNYAPSSGLTSATNSTLALASQARKYGLGLIFATQSPKGLHNRVSGNASTQFFGLLNAPAQISAAQELASRKGSPIPDVGRLPAGTFYAAVEGGRFVKLTTPLCLSHHPASPPTEEEVIAIARGDLRPEGIVVPR